MSYHEFINEIRSISDALSNVIDSIQHEWAPNEPPKTIVLSDVGGFVARRFNHIKRSQRDAIFSLIEGAMAGEDADLRDAVGTGLIESLVSELDNDEAAWKHVESCLGPKSLFHAVSWKNFR